MADQEDGGTPRRALVALVLCALSTSASAEPGDHIKAGDAVITPKISLGLAHSTNALRALEPVPGTDLRIIPGVKAMLQTADVTAEGSVEYQMRKFFQSEAAQALDRFDEFQLGAGVQALKSRPIGFQLTDTLGKRYGFDGTGPNNAVDPQFVGRSGLGSSLRNNLAADIQIRPVSTLQIDAGVTWTNAAFDVSQNFDTAGGAFNRQNSYGPRLGVDWKFFPRTSLVYNLSWTRNDWSSNLIDLPPDGGFTSDIAVPDSATTRTTIGLRGQVTERLSTTLSIGYGGAAFQPVDGAPDPGTIAAGVRGANGLLLSAQAKWQRSQDTGFTLGYSRNFQDAFFTNFLAYDNFSFRLNTAFSPRVGLVGELGVRPERYRGVVARNDLFLAAKGDVNYRFADWATTSAGVWWNRRDPIDSTAFPADPSVAYDEVNIHLFVNLQY